MHIFLCTYIYIYSYIHRGESDTAFAVFVDPSGHTLGTGSHWRDNPKVAQTFQPESSIWQFWHVVIFWMGHLIFDFHLWWFVIISLKCTVYRYIIHISFMYIYIYIHMIIKCLYVSWFIRQKARCLGSQCRHRCGKAMVSRSEFLFYHTMVDIPNQCKHLQEGTSSVPCHQWPFQEPMKIGGTYHM